MKQPKLLSALASIAISFPIVFATVPTFSGELTGDLYYQNGVLLEGVEPPTDPNSNSGESSIALNGTGTLTIGNQIGGGFPRITVLGGTTISSSRTWSEEAAKKTWWDGQFSTPGAGRLPDKYDINYTTVNDIDVVGAFSWGLANESFRFTTPAKAVFPVEAIDNQKLLIAYKNGGTWSVDSTDFCIVENGLCYTEITDMSDIAFIREVFQTCPLKSITNGSAGSVPSCIITCNRGYELNEAANGCVASDGIFTDDGDDGVGEDGEDMAYNDEVDDYSYEEDSGPSYEFPPGYFRYNGTKDQRFRKLDVAELEGDNLKLANRMNRGYLSRNPRSAEEQFKKEEVVDEDKGDDGFASYLLQMRNIFTQDKIKEEMANNELKRVEAVAAENKEVEEGELVAKENQQSETFHSGAPLLPSTGPEVFVTIAVIGFLMMLFGARRRN